jgi:hypothetical protein
METEARSARGEFVLFTTTRPSRTAEVVASEQDLARRRAQEQAWAEQIGMDVAALKNPHFTITGSPTGTKAPHHFDDELDDIIP